MLHITLHPVLILLLCIYLCWYFRNFVFVIIGRTILAFDSCPRYLFVVSLLYFMCGMSDAFPFCFHIRHDTLLLISACLIIILFLSFTFRPLTLPVRTARFKRNASMLVSHHYNILICECWFIDPTAIYLSPSTWFCHHFRINNSACSETMSVTLDTSHSGMPPCWYRY